MAKKKSFLGEFMKNRKEVGSVAPSSRFLVKKMLAPIDFEQAKVIVEYGPGDGVITKKILEKMREDAILLVFETNEAFVEIIKNNISDPRMHLYGDSATDAEARLEEFGHSHADAIVSSLPYTVIPKEIVHEILSMTVRILSHKGTYTQYQYSLESHKRLKSYFDDVKLNFTPINIPPAFVYTCTKET